MKVRWKAKIAYLLTAGLCLAGAADIMIPVVHAQIEHVQESNAVDNRCFQTRSDVSTLTAADCIYSVDDKDEVTILKYTGNAKKLIMTEIDGKKITAIGDGAFEEQGQLEVVQFPDTLRSIGCKAFYHCGFQSIILPDSLETVGDEAFNVCIGLTQIKAGPNIRKWGYHVIDQTMYTDNEANWKNDILMVGEQYAIEHRWEQEIINIPEGVTTIADNFIIFSSELHYVYMPESVKYIGEGAFACCPYLKSVEFAGNDLRLIGEEAFQSTQLEKVYLCGESLEIGARAFQNCTGLKYMQIDAGHVTLGQDFISDIPEGRMELLVLPELTQSVCDIMMDKAVSKKLALTDTSAEAFESVCREAGTGFLNNLEEIDLPFAKQALADSSLLEGNKALYQGEWHLVRYLIRHYMEAEYIVKEGENCPYPLIGDSYCYPPVGTSLINLRWDLDGDGVADRLPGVVTEDITAKALYEIEEAAHDWQLIETIWITDDCDSYGTAKYVCLNCGEQKEELATPRWHDISEEWTIDQEATCTKSGSKSHHCKRSGCNEKENVTVIPATGHKWDNGVVTTEPTGETDGVRTYTCSRCGGTRTEAIARLATPQPVITTTPQPTDSSGTPHPAEPSGVPQPTASSDVPQPGDGAKASAIPETGDQTAQPLSPSGDPSDPAATPEGGEKLTGGNITNVGNTGTKKFPAPIVQMQKKKEGSIRYLVLRVERYQGNRVEICYKKKSKASWTRLSLNYNRLKKKKETFKIRYLSTKGSLYVRVRTWKKNGAKKMYSAYTKQKRISLKE